MNKFKHKQELECTHCKFRVYSRWSGEYAAHLCVDAGKISKRYNHEREEYEPWYPYIAIDETEHYCRLIGLARDYTEIDVT